MSENTLQKIWKMMPNLRPNGGQDRLKIQQKAKKGMRKSLLKFDIDFSKFCWERKAKYDFEITFWLDFLDGPGGKGGVRIQNHFNLQISIRLQLGFDTRHPRRGAADENPCPNGYQK